MGHLKKICGPMWNSVVSTKTFHQDRRALNDNISLPTSGSEVHLHVEYAASLRELRHELVPLSTHALHQMRKSSVKSPSRRTRISCTPQATKTPNRHCGTKGLVDSAPQTCMCVQGFTKTLTQEPEPNFTWEIREILPKPSRLQLVRVSNAEPRIAKNMEKLLEVNLSRECNLPNLRKHPDIEQVAADTRGRAETSRSHLPVVSNDPVVRTPHPDIKHGQQTPDIGRHAAECPDFHGAPAFHHSNLLDFFTELSETERTGRHAGRGRRARWSPRPRSQSSPETANELREAFPCGAPHGAVAPLRPGNLGQRGPAAFKEAGASVPAG